MKKSLINGFSSAAVLSTLLFAPTSAMASQPENNPTQSIVTFEKQVETNPDNLFKRALKGETDLINDNIPLTAELKDEKGQIDSKHLKLFKTTQHIKSEKLSDGRVVDSYATTEFAVPQLASTNSAQIASSQAVSAASYDGSTSNSAYDTQTYTIKAYGTIYWDNYYYSNQPSHLYTQLKEATGGWTTDSTISVTNKKVNMGENGNSYYGYKQQATSFYPTQNTFDYFAPSSWVPVYYVSTTYMPRNFGITTSATLNGHGTSWNLTLYVQKNS
ncbi:hypothetical protein PP175_20905 [Aneurinibacillus sp. Ricciae_BoGa-3]|uniref:hypothetical protein n=1 Tax=Aneurinibacillus sp. Ricciae_BoGa-3 TaxID=3022697 RepID=UPI00234101FC|nr:hypothetical protein [Aneurinibacillus sp. Ricciae_BoGa-3]WCK53755.1 hypothetical protein PP175_20905 [Aneurinibacillus sp. Ricciae_BoGa-3]